MFRALSHKSTWPENHGLEALWADGSRSSFWCLAACDLLKRGLSFQEDTERTQINVLAVQAITSLVLSAMTVPVAGNPAVSCLEQQPRNKPLKALDTRWGPQGASLPCPGDRHLLPRPLPLLPGLPTKTLVGVASLHEAQIERWFGDPWQRGPDGTEPTECPGRPLAQQGPARGTWTGVTAKGAPFAVTGARVSCRQSGRRL